MGSELRSGQLGRVHPIEDWEVLAASRYVASTEPPDAELLLDVLGIRDRATSLSAGQRPARGWLARLVTHYKPSLEVRFK